MNTPNFEIPPQPTVSSPGIIGMVFQQDYHRDKFDNENRLLRMFGISVDAVFIGDSLTEGWPVDKLLRDLFPNSVNRGVGGDCAKHLPLRLEADVLQLHPRNVVLMIGTNDISYRFGYDTEDVIVSDYVRNMTVILERLRASGARCFIGTIPPALPKLIDDPHFNRKNTAIPRMNEALKDLVGRYEMHLVDYYPHFFDPAGNAREDLFSDAVHHTARGQYLMTRILRDAAGKVIDAK